MTKQHLLCTTIAGLLLATAAAGCGNDAGGGASPFPERDTAAAVRSAFEPTMASYVAALRAAGVEAGFQPTIEVKATPELVFYDWSSKTVGLPVWEDLEAPQRALFIRWGEGSEARGRQIFEASFGWFFWAHELSHYAQYLQGALGNAYEMEVYANDAAVAFWMTQPDGERKLLAFADLVRPVLAKLRDPVPAGADRAQWVSLNYAALVSDPDKYGFLQYTMALDAISRRASLAFAPTATRVRSRSVDCGPIATRIASGCPGVPVPKDDCLRAVATVNAFKARCDATGAPLLECYRNATFTCGKSGASGSPVGCDMALEAFGACAQSAPQ